MNIRLQKYKANRLAGMNQYNAARAAGYSHNYANKGGKRIEDLGKVGLEDAFEQAGLTDNAIIKHALEGLNATRNGKPDWAVRHRYYTTILELKGKIQDVPLIDQSNHVHYEVTWKNANENTGNRLPAAS
jgi:hypothetical protein